MDDESAETSRRPRADALRNRERVLKAAKAVFSAGGPDASLEAVARRAGVGIGTLYRHFPSREALFEAVYRHEVDELAALAGQLGEAAPVEALRRWLHSNVEFIATKKGMATAMALAGQGTPELRAYSFNHLTTAIRALLDRAVAAAQALAALSPRAFAVTKRQLRLDVTGRMRRNGRRIDAEATKIWASAQATATIREYVARTLGK